MNFNTNQVNRQTDIRRYIKDHVLTWLFRFDMCYRCIHNISTSVAYIMLSCPGQQSYLSAFKMINYVFKQRGTLSTPK